jgi:hypothetical protein
MDYSLALLSPVADSKTDSRDGRQQAKNGGRERQRKGDLSTEVTGRDKERREVPKVGLGEYCSPLFAEALQRPVHKVHSSS